MGVDDKKPSNEENVINIDDVKPTEIIESDEEDEDFEDEKLDEIDELRVSLKHTNIGSTKNNWKIKSFIPSSFVMPKVTDLKTSVSFIGKKDKLNMKIAELTTLGKSKFEDPDFPCTFESLWGFGEQRSLSKYKFQQYKWARPDKIFHGNSYTVYNEPLCPNDILQGELGDCYF